MLSIFLEMSQDCLEIAINCTNKHGRLRYPLTWPELNHVTMIKFVALLFHFDATQRSNLKSYWDDDDPDPIVQEMGISRRKFMRWFQCLRLYDQDQFTAEQKKTNKTYKVDSYLFAAQKSMQKMRHTTSRHLSLDEEMTTFLV